MSEVRQRWRLVVRRGEAARELAHRDVEVFWNEGLERAGIPAAMAGTARSRSRLVFAAPVPVGALAEREPIDLVLAERLTIADLRARLEVALPPGHELVDLYDVWIGEPSIAGRAVAADYRLEVDAAGIGPEALAAACTGLLAERWLERPRRKGETGRTYDLRPLISTLGVQPSAGGSSIVRMRLRHHPELGNGRPEEVLGALGDRLGRELGVREMVRERLWLAGELGVRS